jgi:hypothetical protein
VAGQPEAAGSLQRVLMIRREPRRQKAMRRRVQNPLKVERVRNNFSPFFFVFSHFIAAARDKPADLVNDPVTIFSFAPAQ